MGPGVRRVRGRLAATLGRYHPARKAWVSRLPGSLVRPPETLLGSLGCLAAPALGVFRSAHPHRLGTRTRRGSACRRGCCPAVPS